MTNPNSLNSPVDSMDSMTAEELKKGAEDALKNGDYDLLAKFSERLKKPESKEVSFESRDISTMTKEDIHQMALDEIKKVKADTSISERTKEAEIQKLMASLNGQRSLVETELQKTKEEMNGLLTNTSLRDYFSLSRMRNSNLLKTIDDLRKDQQNYPKNVLIYAMGITSSKYFGAGQALKRGWAKLTWNRKSDDIKAHIENLIQRCRITSDDSPIKRAMKTTLLGFVREAKDAYIKKLTTQNSF